MVSPLFTASRTNLDSFQKLESLVGELFDHNSLDPLMMLEEVSRVMF